MSLSPNEIKYNIKYNNFTKTWFLQLFPSYYGWGIWQTSQQDTHILTALWFVERVYTWGRGEGESFHQANLIGSLH